jgi:hypothetical protein
MENNNLDSLDFQPRKRLNITKKEVNIEHDSYVSYLHQQASSLDLEKIDFDNAEYDTVKLKVDKQKVYFWIRVYLSEETKIDAGDNVEIKYVNNGETLTVKFVCFSKTGANTVDYIDGQPVIANYNTDDDTKCLCLMVDEERINYDSDDIPFLRKLFRIGRHYDHVLLRRGELELTNLDKNIKLDYYDIDF